MVLRVVSPLFKDLFAVDTQTGSVTSLTAGEQDFCIRGDVGVVEGQPVWEWSCLT